VFVAGVTDTVATGCGGVKIEKRSLFGVAPGTPVILLGVAFATSAACTAAGVAVGFAWRYSAATPATWGVAIDVPEIVFVAVFDVRQEEVMLTPGARISTPAPKFENEANASLLSVAPTVIASATRAGDAVEASADEFPAAIAYTTPSAIERRTASSRAVDVPPPSDILATAGPEV
jgi:hypothetical protein